MPFVYSSLREELRASNYLYGVDRLLFTDLAVDLVNGAQRDGFDVAVVAPSEDADEAAGWVLYALVPQLTIAMAYVEPAYRGLGAWRAMREHIGLRSGQIVGVVLAGPRAMHAARETYQAKHCWGRALAWVRP